MPPPASDIELTRDQVRQVDQLAIRKYGVPGIVLMENAGRNAARIINAHGGPGNNCVVFCGTGNNGGDGCVIARHLANMDWHVNVVLVGDESRLTADAATNLQIVRRMGISVTPPATADNSTNESDCVIDALLGTGFKGTVREPVASTIHALENHPNVVSVDVPSGLDCDSGEPSNATVKASLTISFVARKTGFKKPGAADYTGTVHVVDIGAPKQAIEEVLRHATN